MADKTELEQLRERAAALNIDGRSKMNTNQLKKAIADAENAGAENAGENADGDTGTPLSNDEARAAELERTAGGDGVETRAISVGNVIRNRRVTRTGKRAETRGIYRDGDGRRRVLPAGAVIPAGWQRIESADLEDRIGKAPTAQGDAEVSSGGPAR